jgi:hypothetical protein
MSPTNAQIKKRAEFIKRMKKELSGCQTNSHFLVNKKKSIEECEARLERLEKLLRARSKDKTKTEQQIKLMRMNLEKIKK